MTSTSSRPSGAAAAARRRVLCLLDLTTSPIPRRLLRWRALAQLRLQSAPADVLVHDPSSGSAALAWPDGTRALQLDTYLSDDDVDAANRWAFDASTALVDGVGAGFFPGDAGVRFGDLLLTTIQGYFVDFARLRLALRGAVAADGPAACRIFSADRSLAGVLAADLRGLVADSAPVLVGRPSWLRTSRRLSGPRAPDVAAALRARAREAVATLPVGSRRPRVLVVSESTPMAQMFTPIEAALRKDGIGPVVRVQFTTQAGAGDAYRAAETLVFDRPELSPPMQRGRYAAQWRDLAARVDELELALPAALGARHGPARVPLGYLLEGQYVLGFDYFAEHVAFAAALLDELRPELVVVGNDRWWVGQTFVRLARERGLRTACVQDGVASLVPQWFWRTADLVAANSALVPELLARWGAPGAADRCLVTGQARYDDFVRRLPPPPRPTAQARFGLDPELRWVLFATQPVQDISYQREVLRSILAVPGAGVILRPHPSQDAAALRRLLAEFEGERRIVFQSGGSMFDLLAAADLVLVQFSTVVIEAAILGRPVITANFTGAPDPVPYARYGLSAGARTGADITRLVRAFVEGRADAPRPSEAGIATLIGPVDARSAQRTASALASLLGAAPVLSAALVAAL